MLRQEHQEIRAKEARYKGVLRSLKALVAGETDTIAVMSTIACELYQAFDYFHWVGFYRRVAAQTLKVGPYQGGHGCLVIAVDRGVCGACVREANIQIENDVSKAANHIACSAETKAEIVLPVRDARGKIIAVLDIDSTAAQVFDNLDVRYLEAVLALLP